MAKIAEQLNVAMSGCKVAVLKPKNNIRLICTTIPDLMKKNLLLLLPVILLVITSCSVEKRRYTGGYHLEWNKRTVNTATIKSQNQTVTSVEAPAIIQENRSDLTVSASVDGNIQPSTPAKTKITAPTAVGPNVEERPNPISASNEDPKTVVSSADPRPAPAPADERKTHGLAIAGMVLGILSLISFYGSFLFGLLGIIFGGSAIKRIRRNPEKYKGLGMARAGLICGIIGVALIILLIAVAV